MDAVKALAYNVDISCYQLDSIIDICFPLSISFAFHSQIANVYAEAQLVSSSLEVSHALPPPQVEWKPQAIDFACGMDVSNGKNS